MTTTERNAYDGLKIPEVAEMHRVTRRTVERWIAAGDLPAFKLPGGLVRIAREDAERLMQPSTPTTPVGDAASSPLEPSPAGASSFPRDAA